MTPKHQNHINSGHFLSRNQMTHPYIEIQDESTKNAISKLDHLVQFSNHCMKTKLFVGYSDTICSELVYSVIQLITM